MNLRKKKFISLMNWPCRNKTNYGNIKRIILFSELLISRETADGLLQTMLETLSQLDWDSESISSDVHRVAEAVQKYFQQKVNILETFKLM